MSKQSKMTGADYLLLLLYLDNCSAINGAIRITKMMFLFNMEIAPVLKKKGVSICDEDLPKFSAYNYGPFSKDVYEQVELFQSIGFIKVKNLYATEEMSEVDDWEESAFETEFSEGSCQYSSNQDGKFMLKWIKFVILLCACLSIIFLKASLNTILRIKIIKHSLVISKSTEQLNHRQ